MKNVTPNVVFCEDGKYRWIYEMSLLRNPTVFLLIWKIFFFIILGIFGFLVLLEVIEERLDIESFLSSLKVMGFLLLGMTALIIVGYLIYAAGMRGKYIVVFEMDEKGVKHTQIASQAKKAEGIGKAAILAGILAGNPTSVGIGMNASRSVMYSEFSRVRKVKAYPRRQLIKVNERLGHNQVYAAPEDFDFVLGFILNHVSDEAKSG